MHIFRDSALIVLSAMQAASFAHGAAWFVAPNGDDANSGASEGQPFRTIQRAADAAAPGDTCFIREGTYRETVALGKSGEKDKPVSFVNYKGERVVVDGADLVASPWTRVTGNLWKANIPARESIEAVFCDGRMMVEARWPNCPWEDNWRPEKKWALTDKGSKMGEIRSAALAESGQDMSGGLLYIKLSKGNNCFTRPILEHRAGSDAFRYDSAGIEGRAWNEDSMPERIKKFGFANNRFFVVARGALDAPSEWWHDTEKGELLFVAPDGGDPASHEISFKTRWAGFEGDGVEDIVIDGLEFRACHARFENSRRVVLRNCRFLYPATQKIFPDAQTAQEMRKNLRLHGEENVVERCSVGWAVDAALEVEGSGNRIENCVIHDCNLHGRHPGPGIHVRAAGALPEEPAPQASIVRNCTVYNAGGVGIYAMGAGSVEIAGNHVFNAGLHCVDVSALYVPTGGNMPGTVAHHNWLHDVSGIGFRVDIQGRRIVFHHNLAWNVSVGCKMQGFQLEGYNNTVLSSDPGSGFIVVFEPEASAEERAGWRVRNNAATMFNDRLSLRNDNRKASRPFLLPLESEAGAIDFNVQIPRRGMERFFVDPAQYDFRPKPDGPLDASGTAIPGIAESNDGRAPSIGALETHQAPWRAGADWMIDGLPVPANAREATELARRLRPETSVVGAADKRYAEQ